MLADVTCYTEPESDTAGDLTKRPELTPPKLLSKEGGGDWLEVQRSVDEAAVHLPGSHSTGLCLETVCDTD